MKVHCKYCLPKEEIDIPDFTSAEKLELWELKLKSPILSVKSLKDKNKIGLRNAKYIVLHINSVYGKCNRCSFDKLNEEYINCPKCQALNFNWNVDNA